MAKRISELTPTLLPPDLSSLVEIARPSNASSSGYVSESVPLSAIGTFTWRFFFSGVTTLDEFGSWTFANIPYSQLQNIASLSQVGSATFDISLSVASVNTGSPRYGASSSRIVYSAVDYSYMNYLATGNLHSNTAPVTLPYSPPTYFGGAIPPIISNFHDNVSGEEIYFSAAIATDSGNTLPSEIEYRGYVDVTFTQYMPAT